MSFSVCPKNVSMVACVVLDAEKVIDSCKVISRSLPNQAAKATLIVRSASKEVELLCDIIKLYSALRKVEYVL